MIVFIYLFESVKFVDIFWLHLGSKVTFSGICPALSFAYSAYELIALLTALLCPESQEKLVSTDWMERSRSESVCSMRIFSVSSSKSSSRLMR